MKLHRRTRIWVKPLGNEGENRETFTLKIPETINKVPPPVADSAFLQVSLASATFHLQSALRTLGTICYKAWR
jgi:hypothetical protein